MLFLSLLLLLLPSFLLYMIIFMMFLFVPLGLSRALDIAKKVYGPEHADVATYLNNLARVLKAQVGLKSIVTVILQGPILLPSTRMAA